MRFIPALALAAAVLLSGVGSACAQEKLLSERGDVAIEQESKVDMFRPEKEKDTIPRNFQKQPPLIPHVVCPTLLRSAAVPGSVAPGAASCNAFLASAVGPDSIRESLGEPSRAPPMMGQRNDGDLLFRLRVVNRVRKAAYAASSSPVSLERPAFWICLDAIDGVLQGLTEGCGDIEINVEIPLVRR